MTHYCPLVQVQLLGSLRIKIILSFKITEKRGKHIKTQMKFHYIAMCQSWVISKLIKMSFFFIFSYLLIIPFTVNDLFPKRKCYYLCEKLINTATYSLFRWNATCVAVFPYPLKSSNFLLRGCHSPQSSELFWGWRWRSGSEITL